MGDMLGAAPPPKDISNQKAKAKSQHAKKELQSKIKRGSMMSAIEDIQRLSPEAICLEFDRLVEHTQRHFKPETALPCTNIAAQLMRCLRQHRQQSYKCFNAMEEYRQCVGLATQTHLDWQAEQDERIHPVPPLPMIPPQPIPQPALPEKERRSRSWFKPWTWFR